MNLKDFLKSQVTTFLLFIILFGLLFLIPAETTQMTSTCLSLDCPPAEDIVIKTSVGINLINHFFAYDFSSSYTSKDSIKRALYGLGLIGSFYILLYLIISSYYEMKSKK